jgi:hypothetical protein
MKFDFFFFLYIIEKEQEFPELMDPIWLCDLNDFTALYNDVNKELQGKGQTANRLFEIIRSLERKLDVFFKDIETKKFKYFP